MAEIFEIAEQSRLVICITNDPYEVHLEQDDGENMVSVAYGNIETLILYLRGAKDAIDRGEAD